MLSDQHAGSNLLSVKSKVFSSRSMSSFVRLSGFALRNQIYMLAEDKKLVLKNHASYLQFFSFHVRMCRVFF
jgi:hypothetical protein